ncbi:MAG: prepilin-type N-terminal cleavage/methylation domain-containing protein [Verrucomicrobiota bacterium JB022]|nr:prepilin-type N-terminal cleavage/methylation domain-containing protein [Verrucomicrobiota bacterium JB022]
MPRLRSQRSGFSLVEVIVAMAIAFMSIAVLTQAFIAALNALPTERVDHAAQREDLRWVRAQIFAIGDYMELEDGGEFTTPLLGEIDWEAELEETDLPDLFYVTLEYRWRNGDSLQDSRFEETLLVYNKNWSDPTDRGRLVDDTQDAIERVADRRDW